MSPSVEVAIIAAMPREIAQLVRGWRKKPIRVGDRSLSLYSHLNSVAVCSGPTAASARAASEALIADCAPKTLLSVGFAGSLSREVRVPQIVIPERIVDASSGNTYATVAGSGTLVTASDVVDSTQKEELALRWSAIAVDMEAAAVAEVAAQHGCGFAAVKAVSDDLNSRMDFVGRFVNSAGFRTASFLAYIAPRPSLWPAVQQLRINSERASSNLCSALADILSTSEGSVGALAMFAREHAVSKA